METKLSVYPNGWFKFAFSRELKKEKILSVKRFGNEYVMYRQKDGKINVFDAFCPHLGAHLGVEGKIIEDNIRCPFHGWIFNNEGTLTEVPGTKTCPAKSNLVKHEVLEFDGAIYVWFHKEGKRPFYNLDELIPHDPKKYLGPKFVKRNLKIHIHETIDNLVDRAHLTVIHQTMKKASTYEVIEMDEHRLNLRFNIVLNILGKLKDSAFNTIICGIGHARVRVKSLLEFDVVSVPTPIDKENTAFDLMVFFKKTRFPLINWLLMKYIHFEVIRDTEMEMKIIEGKKFLDTPHLSLADGPIAKVRKWSLRFYNGQ